MTGALRSQSIVAPSGRRGVDDEQRTAEQALACRHHRSQQRLPATTLLDRANTPLKTRSRRVITAKNGRSRNPSCENTSGRPPHRDVSSSRLDPHAGLEQDSFQGLR